VLHPDHAWRLPKPVAELPLSDDWESLLAAREIDAALLGEDAEQESHDEKLRKLAQAELPLLVTHPSCSAIVAFEIDMIRRDVQGVILPVFTGRSHPAIRQSTDWINDATQSPIGEIERIDFERVIENPNRDTVRRTLARDAHFVGMLLGEVNHVSAVSGGSPQNDGLLSDLTVHFGSPRALPARWSLVHRGDSVGHLRLMGDQGSAEIVMNDDPCRWRLVIEGANASTTEYLDWNPSESAIDELRHAIQNRMQGATWQDACRDLEIAETAEISLRRRRTLDVFSETPTEESSFKGFMAAGSCGLLLLIFLAAVVLAVVEGLLWPINGPSVDAATDETPGRSWPLLIRLWPVYPLAIFLLLQLLLFVARKPSGNQGRQKTPSADIRPQPEGFDES
jgi:hypothetical protein